MNEEEKKKNVTVCVCIYVSQSDYLSCDLCKQRSGTRERERETHFPPFVYACVM
jgi:hypothetical protein